MSTINERRAAALSSWRTELHTELQSLQRPIETLKKELDHLKIRESFLYDDFTDDVRKYYSDDLKQRISTKQAELERLQERNNDEIEMINKTITQVDAHMKYYK